MKNLFLSFVIIAFAPIAAVSQEKVDPRAVTECQKDGANFVKINECLPEAHLAFVILDAVETVYGDVGKDLASRCLSVNDDNAQPASVCMRSAIKAAIELASKLPEGTSIEDPLFNKLKEPADYEKVELAQKRAKGLFPDKMMWGMTMYRPLP